MKKYTIEFIGTFFLVLTIAFAGNPVAIGFMLSALVYMGGYISGAHYNPAVTLGLWMSGNIDWTEAKKYIAAQLLGGFVASGIYTFITKQFLVPQSGDGVSWLSAFTIEALFTFALVTVVHHVAVSPKAKGNQYFGLAIGMTVLAAATAGSRISGGAFNPAVGVSPLIFDIGSVSSRLSSILLYTAGPIVGGLLAGWAYTKLK